MIKPDTKTILGYTSVIHLENFRESFSVDDELKKHIREYYINKLQKEREKTREEIKKVLEEL